RDRPAPMGVHLPLPRLQAATGRGRVGLLHRQGCRGLGRVRQAAAGGQGPHGRILRGGCMSTNETQFVEGLIAKAPNDRAPDYIKAKLSIKREELIAWLEQQDGDWINAEVKEGRSGKWYVAVDNWQPE